jgi:hypothetical protein
MNRGDCCHPPYTMMMIMMIMKMIMMIMIIIIIMMMMMIMMMMIMMMAMIIMMTAITLIMNRRDSCHPPYSDDVYLDKLQTKGVKKIYPLDVKRRLQPIRHK